MNFAPRLFAARSFGWAVRPGLLLLWLVAAGACGRTDLFSSRNGGGNPNCPSNDPTCVAPTDGGGLVGGHGGSGTDGGNNTDGGNKTDGSRTDAKVCPTGTKEICGNKIDDDCNGLTDCADPACFGDPACSTPGQEICNNGIDDDGNGLIDCMDAACAKDPACVDHECLPDVKLGALVVGAPARDVNVNLKTAPHRYLPTCAGNFSGGDEAIAFTLAEPAGVDVRYQQTGASILAIFRMPPPGLACDSDELTCAFRDDPANEIAFTEFGAGDYLLIVNAGNAQQIGSIDLQISAFAVRRQEICGNNIDDDGNGLTDCDDPACRGVGSCPAPACVPDQDLGAFSWGTNRVVTVNTQNGTDLYQTSCSRGNGKEKVLKLSLTEPMAFSIDCTDTGSHVLALSQELKPLDACDAHEVSCADPQILPFGCGFAIPDLQPGNYYLTVQAFQAGEEGTVTLSLGGLQETVREICDNGIDDDGDGLTDCADRKCVTSPVCEKLACAAKENLGLLPLDGSPASVVVPTSGAGDNDKVTPCVSQPGGQDADVDFQLPAKADVTLDWAQAGNHVFALYPSEGMLFACEAAPALACVPSAGTSTGTQIFTGLPAGLYHLVVDANAPGEEGGVVVQLSAVPSVMP